MIRFILMLFVLVFVAFPTFAKVVEMNGTKYEVVVQPDGEMLLKPINVKPLSGPKITKLPFVVHGKQEKVENPLVVSKNTDVIYKKQTVEESKKIQVCDEPMGCEMTPEGDCPTCKTEYVSEKKVELIPEALPEVKNRPSLSRVDYVDFDRELPQYLNVYVRLFRDTKMPEWHCYSTYLLCEHGDPVKRSELFKAKTNAEFCKSLGLPPSSSQFFDNPYEHCNSTIVNL